MSVGVLLLLVRHALVVGGIDLGEDVVHVEDEVVYVLGGSHHVVGKGYGGDVLVECIHFQAKYGAFGTTEGTARYGALHSYSSTCNFLDVLQILCKNHLPNNKFQ